MMRMMFRMARAGAHIIGLNCLFDPSILLETMAVMKKALEEQDLHPYLMCQPLGTGTGLRTSIER
jgi:betaine-homocysteine S-methyltransferase